MIIVFQAQTNGPITNMRFEPSTYVLQTGEIALTGTTAIPTLTPCAIWNGAAIVDYPNKYALLLALQATDAEMPRAAEDVIGALITAGTIALTALPAATQTRYNAKKAARAAYLAATT
ncbi:MAG: hypothetical protein ABSC19_06035 [Syntrophorhabdales bacterium]|jgi:hypothetical protein